MMSSPLLSEADAQRLEFWEAAADVLAIGVATAALLLVVFLAAKLADRIIRHFQMRLLAGLVITLGLTAGTAVYLNAFISVASKLNYRVGATMIATMIPGAHPVRAEIAEDLKRMTTERAQRLFVEPKIYGVRTAIAWLAPALSAAALLSILHGKAKRGARG